MKKRTYCNNTQRGFTLLLATLTASLLLVLSSAMFNIAQKQIVLSSIARDSQYAFYAADSAAECALYWDIRYSAFSTTTPFDGALCGGVSIGQVLFPGYGTAQEFEFDINGRCARLNVTKFTPVNPGDISTRIQAQGYSANCTQLPQSDRALERAVEIAY